MSIVHYHNTTAQSQSISDSSVRRTNHDHPTPWNLLSLYSPFYAPLLFENEQSEVRDFAANERTFLSHLRLGLYLAIVAAALLISFHFKEPPTEEERKVGLPLGIVFWVLSLGACASSVALYIKHLEGYGHRRPIVQSGWVARSVGQQIEESAVQAEARRKPEANETRANKAIVPSSSPPPHSLLSQSAYSSS